MLMQPRFEDWEWTTERANRFAYLGNGYSTYETPDKDLTWYLNDADQGFEGFVY
jgi:hypothetical protein